MVDSLRNIGQGNVEGCKAEEIPLEVFGKIDNPDIKHDHCKTNRKQK